MSQASVETFLGGVTMFLNCFNYDVVLINDVLGSVLGALVGILGLSSFLGLLNLFDPRPPLPELHKMILFSF